MTATEAPVTISLGVSLLLDVLMVASAVWAAAEVMRRAAVRGTRARYVWASVERAARIPAIAYLVTFAGLNASVLGDWLMFCVDCVGIALHLALIENKRRNGSDDDFWTGLGKRIGAKLRAWARPHGVRTASARVGVA